MKNMVILLATLVTLNAKAQEFSGSIAQGDFQVRVEGTGTEVCGAQYTGTKPLFLARGNTQDEAQSKALELCRAQACNPEFARRCAIKKCETDESVDITAVDLSGIFDITRNGSGQMAQTQGEVIYSCIVDAFSKKYQVKASTYLEAKNIAMALCAKANGGSSLFCASPDCFDYEPETRRMRILPVNSDIIIR